MDWGLNPQGRGLTEGEKKMVKDVFGDSIDFSKVKIQHGKYLPFQSDDVAMAPNGNIYFPASTYANDFSAANAGKKHHFIHEMTHVWQHQRGHNVLWDGAKKQAGYLIFSKDVYAYKIDPNKKLSDYNLEQQGDLIADYYSAFHHQGTSPRFSKSYDEKHKSTYLEVLSDFIKDPKDARNLPKK